MKITQWTEERDETLRRRIEEGATFRELAAEFGVTRNSIGGRANRLGIASKVTRADGSRLRSELRNANGAAPPPKQPRASQIFLAPRSGNLPPLRCVEVEPLCLTFMELERGQCKYPGSDSPLTFCGHPALGGKPYCGPHNALTRKQEVYQC